MSQTVVIDPGHGGSDPGAVSGAAQEKDLVLRFSKLLAKELEARGLTALLTRDTDVTLSLASRTAIERAAKAACCVSCHMDAGPVSASGMTVWLHSQAPASYEEWAKDTLRELRKVGFTTNRAVEVNRGYRGNPKVNYAWNRDTVSPSMLLELGFVTNPDNLREMEEKGTGYAQAVARAICHFLGVEDRPQDKPSEPEVDYRALYEALSERVDQTIKILKGE